MKTRTRKPKHKTTRYSIFPKNVYVDLVDGNPVLLGTAPLIAANSSDLLNNDRPTLPIVTYADGRMSLDTRRWQILDTCPTQIAFSVYGYLSNFLFS